MKKLLKKLAIFTVCTGMFVGTVVGFMACGNGDTSTPSTDQGSVSPVQPVTPGTDESENQTENQSENQTENQNENQTENQGENQNANQGESEEQNPGESENANQNANQGGSEGEIEEQNPSEEITVTPNAYAGIVEALQARIQVAGYENAEILTIYESNYESNGYLACKIKTDASVYSLRTRVSTDGHSLVANNFDTQYYEDSIPEARLSKISENTIGVYTSDDENSTMVQDMVTKLLGEGYNVMYGTISATSDNGDDLKLGENASFSVYALLEKDGVVSEYEETLSVTKRLGDVYQAVLDSTESNKDNIYRSESQTNTELGEVANNYLAEEKRVAQEEAEKKAAEGGV